MNRTEKTYSVMDNDPQYGSVTESSVSYSKEEVADFLTDFIQSRDIDMSDKNALSLMKVELPETEKSVYLSDVIDIDDFMTVDISSGDDQKIKSQLMDLIVENELDFELGQDFSPTPLNPAI